MLRKSAVSNALAVIFENVDFSWSSLKVTKLSKFWLFCLCDLQEQRFWNGCLKNLSTGFIFFNLVSDLKVKFLKKWVLITGIRVFHLSIFKKLNNFVGFITLVVRKWLIYMRNLVAAPAFTCLMIDCSTAEIKVLR